MEAVQLTETNAVLAEKTESNRSLKRNIGELVMEIKINGKRASVHVLMCLELPHLMFVYDIFFRRTKIAGSQRSESCP